MTALQFITDFADQALLLPVAFGVLLLFAFGGWPRGALAWAAAIGGMLGLMLLLKLHFLSCSQVLPDSALRTPSGHTAAAAAIYGGLLALALRALTGSARWTLPAALGIALAVGATRVLLGLHTAAEAAVGGMVGVAAACAVTLLAGAPPAGLRWRNVAVLLVMLLILLHGLRLPAEAAIRAVAFELPPFACF